MIDGSIHTILSFRSGGRLLAAPIEAVREVLPAFEILRTPGLAPVSPGVISLHGEILPVIDSGLLLGGPAIVLHPRCKFVVIDIAPRAFALLVETVDDLIEIERNQLVESAPGPSRRLVSGIVAVGDEMVMLLDVDVCGTMENLGDAGAGDAGVGAEGWAA
ncbi:MAG: chemotaxis protein CheW [Bacteroidota bacterium]|jgi:purine-binding chemotaxis protein CheW|nr:chemotaxis protein CheW [Bacteroidota bacterium]